MAVYIERIIWTSCASWCYNNLSCEFSGVGGGVKSPDLAQTFRYNCQFKRGGLLINPDLEHAKWLQTIQWQSPDHNANNLLSLEIKLRRGKKIGVKYLLVNRNVRNKAMYYKVSSIGSRLKKTTRKIDIL